MAWLRLEVQPFHHRIAPALGALFLRDPLLHGPIQHHQLAVDDTPGLLTKTSLLLRFIWNLKTFYANIGIRDCFDRPDESRQHVPL